MNILKQIYKSHNFSQKCHLHWQNQYYLYMVHHFVQPHVCYAIGRLYDCALFDLVTSLVWCMFVVSWCKCSCPCRYQIGCRQQQPLTADSVLTMTEIKSRLGQLQKSIDEQSKFIEEQNRCLDEHKKVSHMVTPSIALIVMFTRL